MLTLRKRRVSMLVMGSPQFQPQEGLASGDGIRPIPEWEYILQERPQHPKMIEFSDLDLDPAVEDTVIRLRYIFDQYEKSYLGYPSTTLNTTTGLHDLTCFVLHKLLSMISPKLGSRVISECIRYATSIYMFIIHGPTYYSHAAIVNDLILQLRDSMQSHMACISYHRPLIIWLFSIGLVGSMGTEEHQWFAVETAALSEMFDLRSWNDVENALQSILWISNPYGAIFRQVWESIVPFKSSSFDVSDADNNPSAGVSDQYGRIGACSGV